MIKNASTNWGHGITRPYSGKLPDLSNHVRIAYTGSNGKREIVIVSPERKDVKFNSLLERGLEPVVLP